MTKRFFSPFGLVMPWCRRILRFTCGESVFDGSKFCYGLVEGRGLGSGIGLYENVNMGIGLIYTVGSYEINKTFKFSEVDGDGIVEHLKKVHHQIPGVLPY